MAKKKIDITGSVNYTGSSAYITTDKQTVKFDFENAIRIPTKKRMTIAANLTPLTLDVVKQALHVAYQSAQHNFDRALEFKEQQGANWTPDEEEVLESFRSHVNVVIGAANELGIQLDI